MFWTLDQTLRFVRPDRFTPAVTFAAEATAFPPLTMVSGCVLGKKRERERPERDESNSTSIFFSFFFCECAGEVQREHSRAHVRCGRSCV